MSKNLFTDIPEYVRITIYSQVRSLLNTTYFIRSNDIDDIIQDLLLFYLEKLYNKNLEEPYVVSSLKNEAKKILRTRVRKRFGLFLSLEDITECPEILQTNGGFENCDFELLISMISARLSKQEKFILKLILEGQTLDSIAKEIHVSKSTIYKFFEKIKNNYKK